jgi:hypothetical protein
MTGTALPLVYWRAVADLPANRHAALEDLEGCFRAGSPPNGPDGVHRGRLLTTTMGPVVDAAATALSALWMPWEGKVLDHDLAEGRNLFSPAWRTVMRAVWPGHSVARETWEGRVTTFRFRTWEGPSRTSPEVTVLKIDYDLPESPSLIIRDVLDEIVEIDDGLYLGQALLRRRGEYRRAAWFQLERAS